MFVGVCAIKHLFIRSQFDVCVCVCVQYTKIPFTIHTVWCVCVHKKISTPP